MCIYSPRGLTVISQILLDIDTYINTNLSIIDDKVLSILLSLIKVPDIENIYVGTLFNFIGRSYLERVKKGLSLSQKAESVRLSTRSWLGQKEKGGATSSSHSNDQANSHFFQVTPHTYHGIGKVLSTSYPVSISWTKVFAIFMASPLPSIVE